MTTATPHPGRRRLVRRPRRGATTRPRPRRRFDARTYRVGAERQLRRFRQGSVLAVAVTAMLLLLWGAPDTADGQQPGQPAAAAAQQPEAPEVPPDAARAVDEATATIRDLALNFYGFLPRLVLVVLLIGVAYLAAKAVQAGLHRTLRGWERIEAAAAIARLTIFLVAVVASVSILAGDVRAVVGSVGLLGLAASWALQTPIESFTGWLLNSFRGYYRVGDRIAVGDVFGDVYRIDVLTTTVWEAGGTGKPVSAAQSTGALITFPNWEVLRSNIVNYSRDFPYVWDEVTVSVANESDLGYAAQVVEATAGRVLGAEMAEAARSYRRLLDAQRLSFDVDEDPRVYLSLAESWTDCTVRYLVPIRTRRRWGSALVLALTGEMAKPEHRGRILSVYQRHEVKIYQEWPAAGGGGTSPNSLVDSPGANQYTDRGKS